MTSRARSRAHESFAVVHPPARGNLLINGGDLLGGCCCVPPTAGFGIATGGLPDHPGPYVLSRGQPGRHGFVGDRTAGTPIRTGPRPEPNDIHQLFRKLGDYSPVFARFGY